MKKILLLLFGFYLSVSNAQIASGSVAPDFDAVDINGVSHKLSDYLSAGKTVIIDVSATWCGPCWNYHNTKALDDIYEAYGVDASNEVVVLFVEGDANTSLADLNGTGTNTQGNWVAGTPYPIIDGSNIGSLYQITYFPSVFRICPNGIVTLIDQASSAVIRSGINTGCATPLVGTQNNAHALAVENGFCASSGAAIAKIKNYGENTLTSINLNLKENGNVVANKTFTGTVGRFVTKSLTFDSYTFDPTAAYSFEIAAVNGGTTFSPSFLENNLGVKSAVQVPENIVVKIYTDNYPTEMSWKIKNNVGVIVASGGPYIGLANGGGQDANTTIIQNVTLPVGICYTIQLLDSFGDGWSGGSTPHGIEISDANDISLYSSFVGNFGTISNKANVISTSALGIETTDKFQTVAYPNPTTGILYLQTETAVNIAIVDVLGKVVFEAKQVSKNEPIVLSHLQKGIYMAKMNTENKSWTEKIVIQ